MGSRIASQVPRKNTSAAKPRLHDGPIAPSPRPIGVAMIVEASAVSEIRELARTSVVPDGSTRGMTAALLTPYALDAARHPKAAG